MATTAAVADKASELDHLENLISLTDKPVAAVRHEVKNASNAATRGSNRIAIVLCVVGILGGLLVTYLFSLPNA